MSKEVYVHAENALNLRSPRQIVPILNQLIHPRTVVDIGCGLGVFLYVFKEKGAEKVLGVDGKWVDTEARRKYLADEEFMERDLSEVVSLDRRYDLAICVEVAEHIDQKYADNLVQTLVNASPVILFSAAVPQQGGQHHINEQWPSYWMEKFAKHGYHFHDIIRPLIWNNDDVYMWYKQNVRIVAHKSYPLPIKEGDVKFPLENIIHPQYYALRASQVDELMKGKKPVLTYVKLLAKAVLRKLGLRNSR